MDPFVEWKLNKIARLNEIPPEVVQGFEYKIDSILSRPIQPQAKIAPVLPVQLPEHGEVGATHTHNDTDTHEDIHTEPVRADQTDEQIQNIDGGDAVRVSSEYGYRTHPATGEKHKFHNGADLALAVGDKVYSVGEGVVVAAHQNAISGKYITIDHTDGRRSQYAHLSSWRARRGDTVAKNQIIGLAGKTGRATGPHLHLIIQVKTPQGKWVSRKPTVEEMRVAIGGRDISNLRHDRVAFVDFPLTKRAVNVSIEPYDSVVSEAVAQLESQKPGYFANVKHIIVEPGQPSHFGKVESDKPDTIFLSLDKIKGIMGANKDPESMKLAIIETLAHEMGHLNSKFEGGESPADSEAHRIMEIFNAKR